MNDRKTIAVAVVCAAGVATMTMLVIVAAGWSPHVGYVIALSAIGAIVVLAVRRSLLGVAAPAWMRPARRARPAGGVDPRIATIELTLRRGVEDAGICRRRVQP